MLHIVVGPREIPSITTASWPCHSRLHLRELLFGVKWKHSALNATLEISSVFSIQNPKSPSLRLLGVELVYLSCKSNLILVPNNASTWRSDHHQAIKKTHGQAGLLGRDNDRIGHWTFIPQCDAERYMVGPVVLCCTVLVYKLSK
jgi:hypothetical protein